MPRNIYENLFDITRATARLVRRERFNFIPDSKVNAVGRDEKVTNIDRMAEAFVRGRWEEAFPGIPLIGEETFKKDDPPITSGDYGTCDPIDGTEAFIRQQSHAFSTMLAYVRRGHVLAACVADIPAQEAYAFGPHSEQVLRWSPNTFEEKDGLMNFLETDASRPLAEQNLSCGLHPDDYSALTQRLIKQHKRGGLFQDIEIDKGSIGTRAARVWKGEVGGLLMKARTATPWDDTPIIGFFKQMGFVFLMVDADGPIDEFNPPLLTRPCMVDYETLIIHRSRLPEFRAWLG